MIWDSICNYIIVSDISQSCPIVLINSDLVNASVSNDATVIDKLVDEKTKSIMEIENEIEDRFKN
jgi:hypothetical protein